IYRGPPGVRLFAYPNVERQLAEQLHAVLLGHAPSAARAEDMLFVAALRTDVSAHVLHDAEHRHFDLLEHAQALARIEQRDVLRGRDDHGAAQGHALRKRELRVAGTGRHVDDQIIEIAPLRRFEELHERLRHHGPAPDHGLLLIDEKTDGHYFHAVRRRRNHRTLVRARRALLAEAHHHGLARAVDIRIQETDRGAFLREREREVCRRRRLADAAFPRGNRDDVANALNALEILFDGPGRDFPAHLDIDFADPVDLLH